MDSALFFLHLPRFEHSSRCWPNIAITPPIITPKPRRLFTLTLIEAAFFALFKTNPELAG